MYVPSIQVLAKLDFGLSTHRYKFWQKFVSWARIELQSRLRCLNDRLNEPHQLAKDEDPRTIFRGVDQTICVHRYKFWREPSRVPLKNLIFFLIWARIELEKI